MVDNIYTCARVHVYVDHLGGLSLRQAAGRPLFGSLMVVSKIHLEIFGLGQNRERHCSHSRKLLFTFAHTIVLPAIEARKITEK